MLLLMKTQVIFEPSDFNCCGQLIIRNSFPRGQTNYDSAIMVAYKIGVLQRVNDCRLFMKISLADGLCRSYLSTEELCEELNSDSYGFRPMSDEEIVGVARVGGNRFSS
jgi:hypothetical protein